MSFYHETSNYWKKISEKNHFLPTGKSTDVHVCLVICVLLESIVTYYKVHMGTDPQSLNHQLVLAKNNNFYRSLYDKVSRRKKDILYCWSKSIISFMYDLFSSRWTMRASSCLCRRILEMMSVKTCANIFSGHFTNKLLWIHHHCHKLS